MVNFVGQRVIVSTFYGPPKTGVITGHWQEPHEPITKNTTFQVKLDHNQLLISISGPLKPFGMEANKLIQQFYQLSIK